jgi:tRNA A-37 threonylcarbamoyl transferase component Bud32
MHSGFLMTTTAAGFWFFEFIKGKRLKDAPRSLENFLRVAKAMATIHKCGYAVGDIGTLENIIIEPEGRTVFIDCDPGSPDEPNVNYENDCRSELTEIAKRMFGRSIPSEVRAVLNGINQAPKFGRDTLSSILRKVLKDSSSRP